MSTNRSLAICKLVLMGVILSIGHYATAIPRPKFKFGDVAAKDFLPTSYKVDSSADAVLLFDNGKAYFEGNNEGYLSVIYSKHTRIHLLNKNGFDAATITFPIYEYSDNTYDKIKKFEAVVYNLENGKIVETKVEKQALFKDKVVRGVTIYKFTFPNIKVGSILEYRYTLEVPNPGGLRTWTFQGDYPRLWSELDLSLPDIYKYTPLAFGSQKLDYDTAYFDKGTFSLIDRSNSYSKSNLYTLDCGITRNIWGMQNVPGLKTETYIASIKNFQSRIEFMYTAFAPDNNTPLPVMQNWYQISEDLLKDKDFGLELDAANNYFNETINYLRGSDTNQLELAKRSYRHVRDNFFCTDEDAIYLSQSIRETFQLKKGNVADLNLLLTALYRKLGFSAIPVLLSKRSNGIPPENYPLLRNYNYVLCCLNVNDIYYFLDASIPTLGFNKLDKECFNDNGRLISSTPSLVNLSSDSLLETKTTAVFAGKDENGLISANITSTLSYDESREIRIKLKSQNQSSWIEEFKKRYSSEIRVVSLQIDSLTNLEESVSLNYKLVLPWEDDIIYFNPVLAGGLKENPFKATNRKFPIQLNASFDEVYSMNFAIPDNYIVEELPKSTRLRYDNNKGVFEYLVSTSGNTIYFSMRSKLNSAHFEAEEYNQLRDYFAQIVKKQSELIVFKKKK